MPDQEVIPPFEHSRLPHVGSYRRVLPVSLTRLYENALDWAHLPHLHDSSFSSIDCLAAGPWGWRARTVGANGEVSLIELCLDRACRRWITRTIEGRNPGAEIWTSATPVGSARVDIVVDFFVPGVSTDARWKVGRAFAALYERLYDEDVAMMVERQRQLDRRVERSAELERERCLGRPGDLVLPRPFSLAGCDFMLVEVAGDLVAYPATCPHQLGPLADGPIVDGVVTCPWHGYRFDVVSGDCLTGQTCRLNGSPAVSLRNGQVVVTARH